jgi:alkylated DNA repair dioxygenase AlkB
MSIPGLTIAPGFLSETECHVLAAQIDRGDWTLELKRRVQHFGFRYHYASRQVESSPTTAIPPWGEALIRRLRDAHMVSQNFNQIIVNEYLPGQGITPHIDSPSAFGGEIVSLSLGSACVFTFLRESERIDVLLKPGDLVVMRDDARYLWRHEIARRKTDHWSGETIRRGRRVSVTLRTSKIAEVATKAPISSNKR